MNRVAERGVKALNPRTHKWQLVSKAAKYEVREDKRFIGSDGQEVVTGILLSNENLKAIAKEKGLII